MIKQFNQHWFTYMLKRNIYKKKQRLQIHSNVSLLLILTVALYCILFFILGHWEMCVSDHEKRKNEHKNRIILTDLSRRKKKRKKNVFFIYLYNNICEMYLKRQNKVVQICIYNLNTDYIHSSSQLRLNEKLV